MNNIFPKRKSKSQASLHIHEKLIYTTTWKMACITTCFTCITWKNNKLIDLFQVRQWQMVEGLKGLNQNVLNLSLIFLFKFNVVKSVELCVSSRPFIYQTLFIALAKKQQLVSCLNYFSHFLAFDCLNVCLTVWKAGLAVYRSFTYSQGYWIEQFKCAICFASIRFFD